MEVLLQRAAALGWSSPWSSVSPWGGALNPMHSADAPASPRRLTAGSIARVMLWLAVLVLPGSFLLLPLLLWWRSRRNGAGALIAGQRM